MKEVDIQGVGRFNPHGDPAQISQSWTRWLQSFELYVKGTGIENPNQKKDLLLHCTGPEVQDIFFNLPELQNDDPKGAADVYQKAKDKLNNYFKTKLNVPYELYLFKCLRQEEGENVQ